MLIKNCREHPDMQTSYAELPRLIRTPDHIAMDPEDSQVAIIYGEVSGRLVRVVIVLSDDAEKRGNSILSYRKCDYSQLYSAAQKGYIIYESPEAG
jgi:hypothetical protein